MPHRVSLLALSAATLLLASGCVGARGRRCCKRPCATGSPSAVVVKEPPRAPDVWAFHAAKYDTDRDGTITAEEYTRGEVAFKRLDSDKDGALTEADFAMPMGMDRFIARMAVGRLFQGDDEPKLTLDELKARFAEIDADGDGELTKRELHRAEKAQVGNESLPVPPMPPGVDSYFGLRAMADTDENGRFSLSELETWFLAMARKGETHWRMPRMPNPAKLPPMMQGGVAPGAPAPDFTLEPPGGGEAWRLSQFKGAKPVALIFGSYT